MIKTKISRRNRDNHVSLSAKKSSRDDAFDLSDDEKIEKIKNVEYFKYPWNGLDG
jgi:hypothetical protein